MNRRDFIRQLALMALLATPIGKYIYGTWKESQSRVNYRGIDFLETGYIYASICAIGDHTAYISTVCNYTPSWVVAETLY